MLVKHHVGSRTLQVAGKGLLPQYDRSQVDHTVYETQSGHGQDQICSPAVGLETGSWVATAHLDFEKSPASFQWRDCTAVETDN